MKKHLLVQPPFAGIDIIMNIMKLVKRLYENLVNLRGITQIDNSNNDV